MINVLTIMKNELEKMNIPYTFDEWDGEIELPQWIGEISEVPTNNEDGKSEYSFILTGYATTHSYLFEVANELKKKYKLSQIIDRVVIKYNDVKPVDNGTEDLKQVQVNMTIKEWSV